MDGGVVSSFGGTSDVGSANLTPAGEAPQQTPLWEVVIPTCLHALPPWREFARRLYRPTGQADLSSNPSSASS